VKNKSKVEFFGYCSGDYEAFCFDVPKKTFITLTGKQPDKYDKSYFNKGTYRVYLSDIINMPKGQCIVKLDIEIEELESQITI